MQICVTDGCIQCSILSNQSLKLENKNPSSAAIIEQHDYEVIAIEDKIEPPPTPKDDKAGINLNQYPAYVQVPSPHTNDGAGGEDPMDGLYETVSSPG